MDYARVTHTHTHLTGVAGLDVARLRAVLRVLGLFPAVINHPIGDVEAGGAAHHSPDAPLVLREYECFSLRSCRRSDLSSLSIKHKLCSCLLSSPLPPAPTPRFTRARYSSSSRSAHELRLFSSSGSVHVHPCGAFVRLFSSDRRQTHPIAPRGLSFCSLRRSHWEPTGAFIPLPINRLKSGPDAPRNARSGIYDIKRTVRRNPGAARQRQS